MVELQPLIQVMPPPLQAADESWQGWLVLAGLGLGVLLLWLMRRRLMLWWLRLTVRPTRVQGSARKALKYLHLNAEQRRRLELIAFAPAEQPEHVTQLKALLWEVRP